MGYAVSWIAIRGGPAADVLGALGLRTTGAREEVAESPIVAASLPDGWHVVLDNTRTFAFESDKRLPARLTAGVEAVTCAVEEHVGVSVAAGWRDGKRIWRVEHDAGKGLGHLAAEGELPPTFASIRERLTGEQARADAGGESVDHVFDIPVELARALTGFAHDRDLPGAGGGQERFEVLEPLQGSPFAREKARGLGCLWTLVRLAIVAALIYLARELLS